uniref:Uncharacterized protein n=1 Tax=Arundo donax TaxID=35708 RepID=A0A0A9E3H0_ARUDO
METICFLMRSSRSNSEISPSCKSESHRTVSAESFSGPVPHLIAMDNPKIGTKYLLTMTDKGCDKIFDVQFRSAASPMRTRNDRSHGQQCSTKFFGSADL